MAGNFSNQGRDTHDPLKHYTGVRMQQGVPLLDRDWNESEDIRRYYERMLRLHYLGEGVPDETSFRVQAPPSSVPNDFVIAPGRISVNGYDAQNDAPLLYSQQSGLPPLTTPAAAERLYVYLQPAIERIDGAADPALLNAQDLGMETTLRDQLAWTIRVSRHPDLPPAGCYLLAEIQRPAGQPAILPAMITDRRRRGLQLARLLDDFRDHLLAYSALQTQFRQAQAEILALKQQVARLLWEVDLSSAASTQYFGGYINLTVTVRNGLGEPVRGAHLSFSASWGHVDPPSTVTNSQGRATVKVVGVEADAAPTISELAILDSVVMKVSSAALPNPGSVNYQQVRLDSNELSVISRYTPSNAVADLTYDFPTAHIVARPRNRASTITVHAREGDGAIVRGTGSLQVTFGMWVRDWARQKVFEAAQTVRVGARVSEAVTKGVVDQAGRRVFDPNVVMREMPVVMNSIYDSSNASVLNVMLLDGGAAAGIAQGGGIGQAVASATTLAVGAEAEKELSSNIARYRDDASVELDAVGARNAFVQISGIAAQAGAGATQRASQIFAKGGKTSL
jgi:hypothetical protein